MDVDSRDALQLRDNVLAMVAHDIRNPLGTITMTTALLEDPQLQLEQRQHFLHMIRRATQQIDKLIRDLVDIARIENGQLALEKAPTRCVRCCRRSLIFTGARPTPVGSPYGWTCRRSIERSPWIVTGSWSSSAI